MSDDKKRARAKSIQKIAVDKHKYRRYYKASEPQYYLYVKKTGRYSPSDLRSLLEIDFYARNHEMQYLFQMLKFGNKTQRELALGHSMFTCGIPRQAVVFGPVGDHKEVVDAMEWVSSYYKLNQHEFPALEHMPGLTYIRQFGKGGKRTSLSFAGLRYTMFLYTHQIETSWSIAGDNRVAAIASQLHISRPKKGMSVTIAPIHEIEYVYPKLMFVDRLRQL